MIERDLAGSAGWHRPIPDQVAAINSGANTAVRLTRGVRGDIDAAESMLSAWVELNPRVIDEARSQDHQVTDARLRGISLAVKDLIDVAGLPTRAGSSVTEQAPATRDAACVARFRDLGAVVQGKTVTTEFGYFSPGPTRNPKAPDRTPGGSSSGSAAAVGAGTIAVALGTQTAGSLTRPASFCGTAGMVLAQGTVSLDGVCGLSESLDSLGVLTRTIADLEYVFNAFTGRSAESARITPKVLVWSGSELDSLDPAMVALLDAVPGILADHGISSTGLHWDQDIRALADDHRTVMAHEAAETLRDVVAEHGERLSTPLRELVREGSEVSAGRRAAALERRDQRRAHFEALLAGEAVVVGPAALGPAPAGLSATGSPVLSRPWQLLGAPVVVVPGAEDVDGLPLGLQLIGQPGCESTLFAVAKKLESTLRAMPPVTGPAVGRVN
ncbi:MAG: amidase [Gordonia sp.]|nr:amidase [Gordonia sp. (in: high G+C Gram-positive bacteria)]